jgi:hypothetical protein
MSDWAPFGPSSDDDPPAKPSPAPVEEPVEEPAPEPIELPRRDPEPDDLPPAATFEPPTPPPVNPLPGPTPSPPLAWPAPQQPTPPVGSWPGASPPAYGTPAKVPSNATASLVLGILGVVFCPIVASIPAIALGHAAKREIRANPGLGGDGMASWGIGLGYVGVAFGVLIVLLAVAGTISVTSE